MPREVKHTFKCDICDKEYSSRSSEEAKRLAEKCEKSHDIVYIPLLKEDVRRLWMFLVSKNEDVLTKSLVDTLAKYKGLR